MANNFPFVDFNSGGGVTPGGGSDWGDIGGNINNQTDLPFNVAPDLVTFDRDIQVPQNSINIGDAIKMSDLAQSIGYQTAFDEKQYILLGYEITSDESKRPVVKDFSEGSSFVLQPIEDTTQNFTDTLEILIPAVQQVIGKTYSLKAVCDEDLLVEVFRLADNGGADTKIINEELTSAQTNINGFNFDLVPLVDFELNKNYRIELTPLNGGTLEIKGVLLSGNFVPYIERVLGWEYVNKEIAFREEGLEGLYPVIVTENEQLNLDDKLIICQPAIASSDIELTLPDIDDANNERYFVEVYNESQNDDYTVTVVGANGASFNVKSRDRMLYFPVGNSWESIVLSTNVFTDDTISGTGSYSDPLSVSKLYAHTGITVSDPPFENNTSTPVLVDTWTLNVPTDGTYSISVTVEYNINNVQRDAIFRFDLNGATGININQESKDSTNKIFFTTFAIDDLTAGNNVIEFYASIENPQNPGQRIQVVSNRFLAQKIDELS